MVSDYEGLSESLCFISLELMNLFDKFFNIFKTL
jgi:hypothetical protein